MNSFIIAYSALGLAIASEVLGSTLLQKSEQFSRADMTVGMLLAYAASFYFLSHALKFIPLGVAYAIWAGVGIVLTAIVGVVLFKQKLDGAAVVGMSLIVVGAIVIRVFSKTLPH